MDKKIVPLAAIMDLGTVARSFRELLCDGVNSDIALDFPKSVSRYNGDTEIVKRHLEEARAQYVSGEREQFVAYVGDVAVGMSIVTAVPRVPTNTDPNWPNISLFVCRPYRQKGLGRLLIRSALETVRANFDGFAWTAVRKDNFASQQLITTAGFIRTNETIKGGNNHDVYHFASQEQRG